MHPFVCSVLCISFKSIIWKDQKSTDISSCTIDLEFSEDSGGKVSSADGESVCRRNISSDLVLSPACITVRRHFSPVSNTPGSAPV